MSTPRLNSNDIEKIKSEAGYGEGDVVLSATLFDELVAQYKPSHTGLGLTPNEKVRRA